MQDMLAGKCAIVTGGARGIGRAVASLLIDHGAKVLVCDIDPQVTAETVRALGDNAVAFVADLLAPGAPQELVETAMEKLGAIDIVVNNAGYALASPVVEMSDGTWQSMLAINATVPFEILRSAGPHMIAAARADADAGRPVFRKVINISSTAVQGALTRASYSAAKAAIIGLTRSLAMEWAEHRINVNAVAFGAVDTRLTAENSADNVIEVGGETHTLGLPIAWRASLVAKMPFGRYATPEEAAGGVFLLCTPWSNWIHGQVLTVNGGAAGGMSV